VTTQIELGSAEQLLKTIRMFDRLRDLHPDMTVWQAMVLLTVAATPGIQQRDLYSKLDMGDSSASRTIALLTDVGARGFAGLDLVTSLTDTADRRMRRLYLTPKGKRKVEELMRILQTR